MNKELKLITADVKENTATTYTNNYLRLREALGMNDKRKPVKTVGLDKIEPVLLDDSFNANARAGMLTIVKKLFSTENDKEKIDEDIGSMMIRTIASKNVETKVKATLAAIGTKKKKNGRSGLGDVKFDKVLSGSKEKDAMSVMMLMMMQNVMK